MEHERKINITGEILSIMCEERLCRMFDDIILKRKSEYRCKKCGSEFVIFSKTGDMYDFICIICYYMWTE